MTTTSLSTSYVDGSIYSASDVNATNTVVNALSNGTNQVLVVAKGDILTGSATANNLGKTTVGANDTILTADSAQTNGVKWSATFAGNSATATTAGTVTTAAQPAITSVGTLSSLGVSGTVTAGAFSGPLTGAVTGNVTGNVTGSSGSVSAYAATVAVGTAPDYDLYVGTTWIYGNTNLIFNNTTRIELNNNGTDVIGNLGVSGTVTGPTTYTGGEFVATDATGHFYSNGTYTAIGLDCAKVRNSTYIYTEFITGDTVKITGAGLLGIVNPSSRRFKENIVDYDYEASRLLSVNPVTFDFKDGILSEGENRFNHFGLIAEDLHDAGLTHLVKYDAEGQSRGIEYELLSIELLGIVKKQQTAIDDLLARVQALETN